MTSTETVLEPTTFRETLRAYDVRETGHDEGLGSQPNLTRSAPERHVARSDTNWPSDWRRVPQYRATSRTHRLFDRPGGQDNVEGATVVVMFSGVWMMGALNRLWRKTAGKWNRDIMRYEVGGEW